MDTDENRYEGKKARTLDRIYSMNGNPMENLRILLPRGSNPTLGSQRGDDGGTGV
jgi:hypothetical protein